MYKYKYILYNIIYFILALLMYLIIVTLFANFNVLSYKTVSILSFIYIILTFMFFGFKLAKTANKRGYLSGLIMGLTNVFIMFILSLLFNTSPGLKVLTYYLVLLLSSTFGGMLGINFKKK